jgi:hypothetical protein
VAATPLWLSWLVPLVQEVTFNRLKTLQQKAKRRRNAAALHMANLPEKN